MVGHDHLFATVGNANTTVGLGRNFGCHCRYITCVFVGRNQRLEEGRGNIGQKTGRIRVERVEVIAQANGERATLVLRRRDSAEQNHWNQPLQAFRGISRQCPHRSPSFVRPLWSAPSRGYPS